VSDRRVVTADELADLIGRGEVDTVLAAFGDHQGRLMGKRVTGRFYLDHVSGADGFEACDYLLATDVDMVPNPGYAFANYDRGYGDVRAVVDPSTIRLCGWLDRTALVLCDLTDVVSGAPVAVAPRSILRAQADRAAEAGFTALMASELEFFLFRESYDEVFDSGFRALTPSSLHNQDYDLRQTTRDEWLIAQIRRHLEAGGVPVEFSKGEAESGQHEINLRYAEAVEMADRNAVFKHAVKEIAQLNGRAATFMAKYAFDKVGSSGHIHSSLVRAADGRSAFHDPDATSHMSDTFRWYLGGLMATARELSLLWAPTVNSYKRYQPGSWAPTAVAWASDNRTVGFRVVGHGASMRIENRIPGADVNTYLAFAGTIAAGLHGIANRIEPPQALAGNGYEATGVPRIPSTLVEAIELWRGSTFARDAFGAEVHAHILNTAEQEWLAFNRTVTEWERRRNFERY
jgi:glutamine synthetase